MASKGSNQDQLAVPATRGTVNIRAPQALRESVRKTAATMAVAITKAPKRCRQPKKGCSRAAKVKGQAITSQAPAMLA